MRFCSLGTIQSPLGKNVLHEVQVFVITFQIFPIKIAGFIAFKTLGSRPKAPLSNAGYWSGLLEELVDILGTCSFKSNQSGNVKPSNWSLCFIFKHAAS